jgi:alkylation response protein AidB-like acyl-CoA dehydrogenase
VDFELTDDQLELRRLVRDVAERECPPSLLRAVVEGDDDGDAFWKTLVGLDWPGLAIPVEDGGSGLTAVEQAITLEELGRVGDPTPFLATTSQYVPLVRECVADGGVRNRLLAAVCKGGAGAVVDAPGTVGARRDGDAWVLDGGARYVIDGDRADEVAIVASTGGGVGVFVVPSDAVAATRMPAFDRSLHVAEVRLDGVRVDGERAATGPDVVRGVERASQEAVTGLAAVMVGASQRILELVLTHVKDRKQFGVPIGSFQAVKHMAVDVYVVIERARALVHFAALTIADDDDRRALAASMAKAAAGDCQRLAATHGVQLFGGLGWTWQNDLHMYLRRAKAGELLLGTTTEHRRRVARMTLEAAR